MFDGSQFELWSVERQEHPTHAFSNIMQEACKLRIEIDQMPEKKTDEQKINWTSSVYIYIYL